MCLTSLKAIPFTVRLVKNGVSITSLNSGRHIVKLLGSDYLIVFLEVKIKIVIAEHEIERVEHECYYRDPREHIPVAGTRADILVEEEIISPDHYRKDSEKHREISELERGLIFENGSYASTFRGLSAMQTAVNTDLKILAPHIQDEHCHKATRIHYQRRYIRVAEEDEFTGNVDDSPCEERVETYRHESITDEAVEH